jgi:hypothetical protein
MCMKQMLRRPFQVFQNLQKHSKEQLYNRVIMYCSLFIMHQHIIIYCQTCQNLCCKYAYQTQHKHSMKQMKLSYPGIFYTNVPCQWIQIYWRISKYVWNQDSISFIFTCTTKNMLVNSVTITMHCVGKRGICNWSLYCKDICVQIFSIK